MSKVFESQPVQIMTVCLYCTVPENYSSALKFLVMDCSVDNSTDVDGRVCLVHLVHLQTVNFCLILCQQMTNFHLHIVHHKRTKENA